MGKKFACAGSNSCNHATCDLQPYALTTRLSTCLGNLEVLNRYIKVKAVLLFFPWIFALSAEHIDMIDEPNYMFKSHFIDDKSDE